MAKTAFSRLLSAGFAGLLLIGVAALPHGAAAQNGGGNGAAADAGSFIQSLGTQAIQVLGPSVPKPQRIAVFRQLLSRDFDLPDAARFVLGPAARGLSPDQYAEFMRLFRDTLAQRYSDKLSQYGGEPFRVAGVRTVGDETVVSSEIARPDGAPVRIDWHVVDRGGHPLVSDVYVDGASQKVAQRQEFAGIIQRNGGRPEAVIAALRQQLDEGRSGAGIGSSRPPAYDQQPDAPASGSYR